MQHLFVTKLSQVWTQDALLQLFSRYGEVVDLTWTASQGCAFVEYSNSREAEAAIRELNGKEFHGQSILVLQAEKPPRSSPSQTKTSSQHGEQPSTVESADSSAEQYSSASQSAGGNSSSAAAILSQDGGTSGHSADSSSASQHYHLGGSGGGGSGSGRSGTASTSSASHGITSPFGSGPASAFQQVASPSAGADPLQAFDEQHEEQHSQMPQSSSQRPRHHQGGYRGSSGSGEQWSQGGGSGGSSAYSGSSRAYGMGGGADGASGEGGGGDSGHYPVGPPYESGRGGTDGYSAFDSMGKQMEGALPHVLGHGRMDRPQHVTIEYGQHGQQAGGFNDYGFQGNQDQQQQQPQYMSYQGQQQHPGQQQQQQQQQHQFHSSHHQQQQQQQQQFGGPGGPSHHQPQMMRDFHGMQSGGFDGYSQGSGYGMMSGAGGGSNGGGGGGGMFSNGGSGAGGFGSQMGRGGGGGGLGRAGSQSSNGPLGSMSSGLSGPGSSAAGSSGGGNHSHCDFPLRILVPSDMIGAIIGKEGHTIRAITEHTGARVDVHRKENPGAAEKAITIIGTPEACSAASKSIADIMQKEAMTNSSYHTDKCQGPHGNLPCIPLKVLAHNNLVGRVIGKNGNTLKKIMTESDTKITISKLCELTAANMERTITVVGTIQCSSKAEGLISMKLRASYECDMNHLIPQQHWPSHMSMRGSGSSPVSPVLMSPGLVEGYSGDDGFLQSPSNAGASQIEIVHLAVPSNAVGAIIGTKGKEIRNISQLSGATLRISRSCDDSTERIVTIQGNQEAQWAAQNCIFNKVREECFPNQTGGDEMQLRVELTVPAATVGRIIGKGGTAVRELQRKTGAMVEVPRGQQSENVTVRILGNFHSSQVAQRHIKDIVSQAQQQQEQQQQMQQLQQGGAVPPGPGASVPGAGASGGQSSGSQGQVSPLTQVVAQAHAMQQQQQQQQSMYAQHYMGFPSGPPQPPSWQLGQW